MEAKQARYKKIKMRISNLGMAIPGTIRTIYQRCGKSNCSCSSGQISDRHGPYIFWDRKRKGSLSSVSLSADHKKLIQEGIANRKKLEKLVREMLKIGEEYATSLKKL